MNFTIWTPECWIVVFFCGFFWKGKQDDGKIWQGISYTIGFCLGNNCKPTAVAIYEAAQFLVVVVVVVVLVVVVVTAWCNVPGNSLRTRLYISWWIFQVQMSWFFPSISFSTLLVDDSNVESYENDRKRGFFFLNLSCTTVRYHAAAASANLAQT